MLDMGFIHDVTRLLDRMNKRKNLGLFSATISREVMDISWVYQRDPVEITVRADEENKPDITQYRLDVERNEKVDTMVRLMEMGGYDRVIAFCNTKNMTDRLAGLLRMRRITCEAIHGDIQQRVREKTLQKFREGQLQVLAATDVAARGLDIDDVDAVFNYDVPDENEYYIHRIGRTGRAQAPRRGLLSGVQHHRGHPPGRYPEEHRKQHPVCPPQRPGGAGAGQEVKLNAFFILSPSLFYPSRRMI